MKMTSGDVFRINITPPSDTFPWIKVFLHEYGIKESGQEVGSIDASKGKSKGQVALEIGDMIIANSKVLKAWPDTK